MLKLANFLENIVPDKKFDLSIIAMCNTKSENPSVHTCGTSGCAIGWLPNVFPRLCKYHKYYFSDDFQDLEVVTKISGSKDFEAAEEIFDLDTNQAEYLFMPGEYGIKRGRKTVAGRIRRFVRDNGYPASHSDFLNGV